MSSKTHWSFHILAMRCLDPFLTSLLLLSVVLGISAQDCDDDGVSRKHNTFWLSNRCDKAFQCVNSQIHVAAPQWACPLNGYCDNGECKCNAQYDVGGRNRVGWVDSCKLVDPSCTVDGVRYEHEQRWLSADCTNKFICRSAKVYNYLIGYKCYQNSQCINGECVCNEGFRLVTREQYIYCERVNFNCEYEGITIKDGSFVRTADCSKLIKCSNADTVETDEGCAENMHCENRICLCDEKYRPSRIMGNGRILACARFDFTCELDGKKRDNGASWLSEDCTKSYRCKEGNPMEDDYECPRFSHCVNRMCYCDEGFRVSSMLSTGLLYSCARRSYDVDCTYYFYEYFGMCVRESPGEKNHIQATEYCADRNSELLVVDRLHHRFMQLSSITRYQNERFFIGGSPIFDDVSALPNTPENQQDIQFIASIIAAHNIQNDDHFKRFSPTATVDELNADTPLSSLCLAFDFTPQVFGPVLIDCNLKIKGICQEDKTVRERDTEYTDWYDVNKDTGEGNKESINDIVYAYKKRTLPEARLCRTPLEMQCREVGTNKMYSATNTHGYVLEKPCVDLAIECNNADQTNGKQCPNFEIRLKCLVNPMTNCATDSVRQNCESSGHQCEMRLFGAVCAVRRSQRTGYERIGVGQCTVDSRRFNVYTCSVKGPRYSTLDGENYDFNGKCSYTLAATKEDFRPTSRFPAFSVVKHTVKDADRDNDTVAFDLTIGSVTYSFNGDSLFVTKDNTVQANPIGYRDNNIIISARREISSVRYRIDTSFCLVIVFDDKNGLQISLPHEFKIRIVGMCGNFDGKDDNDVRLPHEYETTTTAILGDYYLVSGGIHGGRCVGGVAMPDECNQEDIKTSKGQRYCGVFDYTRETPLTKAILDLSNDIVKEHNIHYLNKLYQKCIRTTCLDLTDEGRCHFATHIIDKLAKSMNLDEPDFESKWRKYIDCEDDGSSICDGIPNTVYQKNYKPNCQDSCFEVDRSAQCADEEEKPGCACKDGYYLDARLVCVPSSECQKTCKEDLVSGETLELNNGDTFVIEPCVRTITCKDGQITQNTIGPCSEFAKCVNYGQKCTCRHGFTGDGITCESVKSCRGGYHAVGDKCYKFVQSKLDWHSAAINCGVDGSQLARYDSPIDEDLAFFIHRVPHLYLQSQSSRVRKRCYSGRACLPARNAYITLAELAYERDKADCKDKYRISKDKKSLLVSGGCNARFIIGYVDYNFAKNLKVEEIDNWIGGNSYVIGPRTPNSRSYFQVDVPKLIDPVSFEGEMGCYMASLNSKGSLIVRPDPNCDSIKYSVCEYDNTEENLYDPNDFLPINERVIFQRAIELCEEQDRPLVTISNGYQLEKVKAILAELGGDGWLGARYATATNSFVWPGNQPVVYQNWRRGEPNSYDPATAISIFEHCVTMSERNGRWSSSDCGGRFYPICGPHEGNKPTVYTSFFSVDEPSSLDNLREKVKDSGLKEYICLQPLGIECAARENGNGPWISDDVDTSGSITCNMNDFSCESLGNLDCTTFQVRFLCPTDENQCKSLTTLGVTPCDQQRICLPVRNHYACRCPDGRKWNKYSKQCTRPCGECHARGDPHYNTLNGQHYSFQGKCKYLFSGICEFDRDGTSPSFDLYTQNIPCGDRGATCLKSIEIKLTNMPVVRGGVNTKADYLIKVPGDTNDYTINGATLTQNQYSVPEAFSLIRRFTYFFFEAPLLDITVLFSGNTIKLTAPEKFKDKMCGLCGHCADNGFKLRNGTVVTPDANSRGKITSDAILPIANDWLQPDENNDIAECKDVDFEDCPQAKLDELAQNDKCGIFKDTSGKLKDCFDFVDATVFFENCRFDACLENPQDAICNMIKSYAQGCNQQDVTLDWRRADFCPYTCTGEKEYRSDASCAPTCGQNAAQSGICDEDPEEGCVCPRGKMRLGESCVTPDKCGCLLILDNEANEWLLPPGETLLMPGCHEKVKCEINEDGVARTVSEPFSLDANAICKPEIPPEFECRKGYILAEDGVTCNEDPNSCTGNYQDRASMCVDPQPDDRIWRQAIETCNKKDGTLVKIETEGELDEIADIIKEYAYDSAYISGQVKAAFDENNRLKFQPLLTEDQQNEIEYTNFDFEEFLLPLIKLSSNVDRSNVKNGDVFALLVSVTDNDELSVTAVPRDTKANYICEERKVKDNDTTWTEPCNSDSYMGDGGDRETKTSVMKDPDCLVCENPKDVRCEAINATVGSVNGTCKITSTGTYYYCDEGSSCIDKGVRLLCVKDIDECVKDLDDCTNRMVCINTIGAYICQCKEDYPTMVAGKCTSEITCKMAGPENSYSYVYELNGFMNKSALFDYNCPFSLASMCDDSFDNSVPYVQFYVLSVRKAGALQTHFVGAIFEPVSRKGFIWSVTPESLTKATIKIGTDYDSTMEVTLGFTARSIQTQFNHIYPRGLLIQHINNYFRIIISYPNKVEITFSESYKDMLCGLCAIEPVEDGGFIRLNSAQEDEISVSPEKRCNKNGNITTTPVPMTTTPMITTVGVSTTSIVPSTTSPQIYPFCDLDLIEVCDQMSLLCQVPKAECIEILCSGTSGVCDYLSQGNFDSCLMDSSMTKFIESIPYCDEGCGSNMKFQYTTKYNQPSCSLRNGMTVESFSSGYGFTCVCDDDYILSGNECVRNQYCGCTLDNGFYWPMGATWRSADCSYIRTCLGDENLNEQTQPCGPNTECSTNDEGFTCTCLEDYYGDANMPSGCKDADVDDDGNKTCVSYPQEDGSIKKECTCNMGFRSNCEDCLDIDECKEAIHDCDIRHEKCINTPGSFECDCADGYEAKTGVCVDIDECTDDFENCGDNEGCINEIGSFRCECCIGFRHNPETDSCERDEAVLATLPDDVRCCVDCPNPVLCDESLRSPVPFCYVSKEGVGTKYPSFKALYEDFCINNYYLNNSQVFRGQCPNNTNPVTPETPTTGNPNGPMPDSCDSPNLCSAFPPPPPKLQTAEVCGPSNAKPPKTYPSYCDMLEAVCKAFGGPSNVPIQSPIDAKEGPCGPSTPGQGGPGGPPLPPSDPLFTNWSPFSPCSLNNPSENCGQGVQIRDRDVVPYNDLRPIRVVEDYELKETRTCFVPCDPKDVSANPGICPDASICGEIFPVCGYVGRQQIKTYNSECALNVTACQEATLPVKLDDGQCDQEGNTKNRRCEVDGPLMTLHKVDEKTGNVHCVAEPTIVGSCAKLLCDGKLDNCCQPLESEVKSVEVQCYDTVANNDFIRMETRKFNSAVSCICATKAEGGNK